MRCVPPLWLAALVVSLVAISPGSAQNCIGPNSPARGLPIPPSNTASDDVVPVRVKGTRFAIPRSYFRYPPECGEDQKAILLRALLPDMIPATPENEKRLYNVEGGWGPKVQFIYGDVPHNSLDHVFKVYSLDLDHSLELPLVHGLKFAARARKVWPLDVFFAERDGHIQIVIWCTQQQDVPYPGCTLADHYRNEIVRVHFDRRRLDDWRVIRSKVVEFLDSLAVPLQSATPQSSE